MKRRPDKTFGDDIHSLAGWSEPARDTLERAIYDAIVDYAQKQPTGLVDGVEVSAALTFHLIQNLRTTPEPYKKKAIDSVVSAISALARLPLKPGEVMVMQEPGEA